MRQGYSQGTARYPPLRLAFHKGADIPPGLVRSILTKGVGLTEENALQLLGTRKGN